MGIEDDMVVALNDATILFATGRYDLIASVDGDVVAAQRVTQVADVFVAWFHRLASIKLTLVAIEDPETGIASSPPTGGTVTTIADGGAGSVARYVIDAADARGFPVDATLSVMTTDADGTTPSTHLTAEILEATSGTASGKDELLVSGTSPGESVIVKVFDPANPDTIFGSDSVDVTVGGVATVTLNTPTIEDAPATP